jgi:hypothetical protein
MLALLATTLAALAGGDFGLSVDVLDEVCLDDANVEIHLAVIHGSYPESPWYRWDFDADGTWDTAADPNPEQFLVVPEGSVLEVWVGARTPSGDRARARRIWTAIDCP